MMGGFAEFDTQGHLVRHNVLPSIQDLTFTWTNDTLRSITDASARGFTLTYAGGVAESNHGLCEPLVEHERRLAAYW